MSLSKDSLVLAARKRGFRPEMFEKTMRLMQLLSSLHSHPFLKGRLALKGGTAINLFHLGLPRLSVDIDVNYVGRAGVEGMKAERPELERSLREACSRCDLQVRQTAQEHAGGKWLLDYQSALGHHGNLSLDVNLLQRVPLWPARVRRSAKIAPHGSVSFPVMDLHELTAGKLCALLTRSVARDIFDACQLFDRAKLNPAKLRLAFVVYAGASREEPGKAKRTKVDFNPLDLKQELLPMLDAKGLPKGHQIRRWAKSLVGRCRKGLAAVLPLRPNERRFLEQLNRGGLIKPELLTSDKGLQRRILAQPGLQWKALNVSQHLAGAARG